MCSSEEPDLDQAKLMERVLNCPRLPSLPTIAIEVVELCRRQDINIKHIATTISNDPALSSKILKTVNSSFYGLSQSVSTISHALVILGLNSVKTLALGFSLIDTFRKHDDQEFDMMRFWQRCIYSAVGARSIAQAAEVVQLEEAFLGGLLQDVGMMGLMQALDGEYQAVLSAAGEDHCALLPVERERLGIDHPAVGAALGEKWKLPPVLLSPIRHHEEPDEAPQDVQETVRAVSLGSRAAEVYLRDDPQALEPFFKGLHEWFGLDTQAGEQLLETIGQATQELAKLFDISTENVRQPQEILAEANEALLELSVTTQQNATKLEDRNRQLQEEMTRDALTGAANRGKFDGHLSEQFGAAVAGGTALGLVFLDADKFKSVNDTHGHQAGDAVLVALAATLMAHAPEGALVSRYGGEEFAVVIPGADRKQTARLAETLRQQVEQTPIDCGEGLVLHVTVSMGVACVDGSGVFDRPEQLIEAADRAVYAAKRSGRNCVRVFVPEQAREAQPEPRSQPQPQAEPQLSTGT
jgi:diguanylate cyclase (GGDEF)-like protein